MGSLTPTRGHPPRLVSVVVPIHNAEHTLDVALRHLAAQDYSAPWEVVLVDNRSTDLSARIAQRWRPSLPRCRIVEAHDRAGVSHARNVGVDTTEGELVAICDADDATAPDWLREMVAGSARGDLVAGHNRWLNPMNSQVRYLTAEPEDVSRPLPRKLGYLPFVGGCNFAAWRDVIRAVDGWDEELVGGADDVDFAWRALRLGYRLHFQPSAVIDYRARAGLHAVVRQRYVYGLRDAQLIDRFRTSVPTDEARLGLVNEALRAGRVIGSMAVGRTDVYHGARLLAYRAGRLVGQYRRWPAPAPLPGLEPQARSTSAGAVSA